MAARETLSSPRPRDTAAFRRTLRVLRTRFPAPRPVHAYRRRHARRHGRAFERSHDFVVWVNADESEDAQVHALIHEWAHLLTWDEPLPHGPRWGIAYARLYRWLHGEEPQR